jgi:hypothetical protein
MNDLFQVRNFRPLTALAAAFLACAALSLAACQPVAGSSGSTTGSTDTSDSTTTTTPTTTTPTATAGTIADYTVAKDSVLRKIPASYINTARDNYEVAYWHTSHGTHVAYGVYGLPDFKSGDDTLFAVSNSKASGKLYLRDYYGTGTSGMTYPDLSQTDLASAWTTWVTDNETFLEKPANADVDIMLWSWCDIKDHDVTKYLSSMQTLIDEYGVGGSKVGSGKARANPVTFIFMTGHGNAGANTGTKNPKAQAAAIVDYCTAHKYYCIDYYSIDTHTMDDVYYEDSGDNSQSDAYATASGSATGRFNQDYQDAHERGKDWFYTKNSPGGSTTYAEHNTQYITANRKAYAFWWVLARVAGWSGV